MALETCSKCGMTKDGTNRSYCKACFNAYSRERTAQGRRKPPAAPRQTCAKCGLTPKDGSHYSYCKRCFAEYVNARYVPHPIKKLDPEVVRERERQRSKRWYEEHREEVKARYQPVSRASLPPDEKLARKQAAARRYYRDNAGRAWNRSRCRRHGVAYVEDVYALIVLELDDGVCGICGEDVDPFDYTLDHIRPLSRGGEHSYRNIQLAHRACNSRKNNRLVVVT